MSPDLALALALAELADELEERLAALWDEQRALKARARFGDRDEIIKRARHEERLARAACAALNTAFVLRSARRSVFHAE